jgi:two-component sensor histidine kinase/putative methionine-R-sulfoxide reductase with GAF domain
MTSSTSLQQLADELSADLALAYGSGADVHGSGGEKLVDAFGAFGAATRHAGLSLEDALSTATGVLQEMFERYGGSGSDPSTFRAAGIALAAVARAHADAVPRDDSPARLSATPPTQMARLSALHQINRAATANLKLSEMLDTTARVVAETTHSDACSVFLYDESTGLLSLRAAVGLSPSSVGAVTLRMGSGITGRAALEGRLIAAADAHSHESFLAHPGIGDEMYTSQVSVPMLLQGQNVLVGVLNINSIKRRIFDQDELEFLRTVAGELAISIENARQYSSTDERLRQKVAELGTLQRVTRMLASTLDLEGVLKLITEYAVELVQVEAAAIFRPEPKRSTTSLGYAPVVEHRIGTVRELANIDDRNQVVSEVLQTGSARKVNVQYVDGMATLFCLPLRSARDTVGALCFRLRPNSELSEDTLGLLQAFCDSAAMAIDNAQLYQDAMHSVQTQSALVQEMHHRVRNNLQTVAALLSLQLRTASDAPWATELREAISRIQAIAAVHDLLSDEQRLAGTTVDKIARLVAEDAHSTLIPPGVKVRFDIRPTTLMVPSRQATIMSLLINELTANAIHHGFRGRKHGYIRIRAWEDDGMANVEVFNDGHKIPDGLNPATSQGLGMRITQRLVTSDLKGTFAISSDTDGTTALMRFPIAAE